MPPLGHRKARRVHVAGRGMVWTTASTHGCVPAGNAKGTQKSGKTCEHGDSERKGMIPWAVNKLA